MSLAPDPIELADVDLAGALVRLRPICPEDARAAFPLIHARDPILRWLVWKGPADVAELEEAYSRWALPSGAGTSYRLAIVAREDDSFQGSISLRYVDQPYVGDVGYWIAERAWGRGYATEANRLVARLAFAHLRSHALTAEVFEGNLASARVLERVGYLREESVALRPLGGEELEIDRVRWTYVLSRQRFERAER